MGNDDFVRVPKALALRLDNYLYNGFEPDNQTDLYKAFKAVCEAAAAPPSAPSGGEGDDLVQHLTEGLEAIAGGWVDPEDRFAPSHPSSSDLQKLARIVLDQAKRYRASGDNVSTPSGLEDAVTDDMLNAAQARLSEMRSTSSFNDHEIAEMYLAMVAANVNVSTPSELEGSSAALRAQVIEECAKIAEEVERYFQSPEYATDQPLSSFNERFACRRVASEIRSRLQPAAASEADNVSTPQSTGLSAIAQERDVGKIPDDIVERILAAGKAGWAADEPMTDDDHKKRFAEALEKTRERFNSPDTTALHSVELDDTGQTLCFTGNSPNSGMHARMIAGAWNHLFDMASLQREALSEAPISAEAVKSNDVAEMVERLRKVEIREKVDAGTIYEREPISSLGSEAASLLQSLARERERAISIIGDFIWHSGAAQPEELVKAAQEFYRSALPHPDTKGT